MHRTYAHCWDCLLCVVDFGCHVHRSLHQGLARRRRFCSSVRVGPGKGGVPYTALHLSRNTRRFPNPFEAMALLREDDEPNNSCWPQQSSVRQEDLVLSQCQNQFLGRRPDATSAPAYEKSSLSLFFEENMTQTLQTNKPGLPKSKRGLPLKIIHGWRHFTRV